MYRGKFGWERMRDTKRKKYGVYWGERRGKGNKEQKKKEIKHWRKKLSLLMGWYNRGEKSRKINTLRNTRMWSYIAWQSNEMKR